MLILVSLFHAVVLLVLICAVGLLESACYSTSYSPCLFTRRYRRLTQVPTYIPAEVTQVELMGNRIRKIPLHVLSHRINCKKMFLDRNEISTIEEGAFSGLVALTLLDLSHNHLSAVHHDTFSGLTALEFLYLQYNAIHTISPGSFETLTALFTLSLDHNSLSAVHHDTFSGLSALKFLNLHHNIIASVEPGSFVALTSLMTLTLYQNRLTSLSEGTFGSLESRILPLTLVLRSSATDDNNMWKCDVTICWLKYWKRSGEIQFGRYRPRCTTGTWSTYSCGKSCNLLCVFFLDVKHL